MTKRVEDAGEGKGAQRQGGEEARAESSETRLHLAIIGVKAREVGLAQSSRPFKLFAKGIGGSACLERLQPAPSHRFVKEDTVANSAVGSIVPLREPLYPSSTPLLPSHSGGCVDCQTRKPPTSSLPPARPPRMRLIASRNRVDGRGGGESPE